MACARWTSQDIRHYRVGTGCHMLSKSSNVYAYKLLSANMHVADHLTDVLGKKNRAFMHRYNILQLFGLW